MRRVVYMTFTSPQPLYDPKTHLPLLDDDGSPVEGPVTKVAFRTDFDAAEDELRMWLRDIPDSEGTLSLVDVEEFDNGTIDMKTVKTVPKHDEGRKVALSREDVLDAAE